MWLHLWKQRTGRAARARACAPVALLFLFSLSALAVACGSPATSANVGQPQATVTIDLNQTNASPTPPLPAYTCSAWVTNTTPNINGATFVDVYAKFVHNVNGNPQGVFPASGTASVLWPDGNQTNIPAATTADGLAVFPVSIARRRADINRVVLVTVSFTGPQGVPPCVVSADRAAFFSPIVGAKRKNNPGQPPTGATGPGTPVSTSPVASPSAFADPCPSPIIRKKPRLCP